MTQFNAHQPEQNSKANLVEAWKIAHAENVRLVARVTELEDFLREVVKLRDSSMDKAVFWLVDNTDGIQSALDKGDL
jgi:hypothetical protein